jgi:BlaI family transcriptional regulator, penicillinase repressor
MKRMSDDLPDLGALEREVMQLVWVHAPVTAETVRERLKRPLKESTVRTVLRRLEEKGFVSHSIEGRTYVFRAVDDRQSVAAKAVRRVAEWFCNGSIEDVLIGIVDSKMLDKQQLEQLSKKIEEAERKRRT